MRFELIVLGSSAAAPAYGRFCSGQLLCLERYHVLIDCGEGTQMQLQKTGEGLGKLSYIFITHLHGDHYFGLPGLLTSLALSGRKKPLTIVSPPGLKDRLSVLLEYDQYPSPFPIEFIEHHADSPSVLLENKTFSLTAFPLDHRVATNGYLIKELPRQPNIKKTAIEQYDIPFQQIPGIKAGGDFTTAEGELIPHEELTTPATPARAFAYCSDTRFKPELASWLQGVDFLYHEATFIHDDLDRAIETGHSTAKQAAEMAKLCNARQLLIGHFSARHSNLNPLLDEARSIFPKTSLARELEHHCISSQA